MCLVVVMLLSTGRRPWIPMPIGGKKQAEAKGLLQGLVYPLFNFSSFCCVLFIPQLRSSFADILRRANEFAFELT